METATPLISNTIAMALSSIPASSSKRRLLCSSCKLRRTNCSAVRPSLEKLLLMRIFRTHRRRPLRITGGGVLSSTVTRCRITCGVSEISESEFSEIVLNSRRPVLVEFVAEWCGPCRLISPAIDAIAQEYADRLTVVKIDHDANPKLIQEYKVYGLPALILFKDGNEVPGSRREGAITKVKLKEHVDALLDSLSVV
ncbi:hypothetical protein Nepgr_000750 [Nepenthes gracilis]|uniref:Thioredoxin domain-containing protein n=1 Tax=Nepenthes gracilis TaxID=150966 RepID=A0AAD3RWR9_NEPGR|nr:hypothetical protein Nepgr_000750 [Nepenthes gracilis]